MKTIEVFPNSYKYELTITFNPKYYPLGKACSSIDNVVIDVEKAFYRFSKSYQRSHNTSNYIYNNIAYCVEYFKALEEGHLHYPHIHMLIQSEIDLEATKLFTLEAMLRKKYGRTTLYYTGTEDKFHEASGMLWSQYLLKELLENEVNGKDHFFQYQLDELHSLLRAREYIFNNNYQVVRSN